MRHSSNEASTLMAAPPRAKLPTICPVTDCGKGIPALEQSRIFERLYRSPSVEHQVPGSGLGLSIAQNIVRAHQGDLIVVSRPGETTFQLTLPADQKGRKS